MERYLTQKTWDIEEALNNGNKRIPFWKMICSHLCCSNNFFKVEFENFLDDLQIFATESIMTGASFCF